MAARNRLREADYDRSAGQRTLLFMGASALLHLMVFFALQSVIDKKSFTTAKDYRVELESASVQDSLHEHPANYKKPLEEVPSGIATDEDTISLDTTDKRYSEYADIVRERVMNKWNYPSEARREGHEGHVKILFTIEKNGGLSANRIFSSSSHPQLDREAQDAIKRSAPFPPLFGSMKLKRLHVNADFHYSFSPQARDGVNSSSMPAIQSDSEKR